MAATSNADNRHNRVESSGNGNGTETAADNLFRRHQGTPTSSSSDWELDLACFRPWLLRSTRSPAPRTAPKHDRDLPLEPLAAQGEAAMCRGADLRQHALGDRLGE
jgi:hypothetical protein